MKRYIALLRGVNVSGKNRIAMSALKEGLLSLGFAEVLTHLNSGNVIFSAAGTEEPVLAARIRNMIQDRFALDIPVFVITQAELAHLLSLAPDWWGTEDKAIYDNLVFPIPPAGAEEVAAKIGEPTAGLERICICENAVFWSFDRKRYAKANWWNKTASAGIGEMITIRTASTLRKIAGM